jgi:hypothetical protein
MEAKEPTEAAEDKARHDTATLGIVALDTSIWGFFFLHLVACFVLQGLFLS